MSSARVRGAGVPLMVGLGLIGGVAMGALGMLLFGEEAEPRYRELPTVLAALPDPPAEPMPATAAAPSPSPPAEADPALLDPGPHGMLPRIAPDGRGPFRAYARAPGAAGDGPRVALLVDGLGIGGEATERAIGALPAEVGLIFSPDADGLDLWLRRARAAGHEVYLALPLEPESYPADDPGPYVLLVDEVVEARLDRLAGLLGRASGYVGLAGRGGRFADGAAAPMLEALAGRGLALVELGGRGLYDAAGAAGLPYAHARGPIDAEPTAAAIDAALEALEAEAHAAGHALAFGEALPITLERVAAWHAGLGERGVALVPPSALLALAAEEHTAQQGDGH